MKYLSNQYVSVFQYKGYSICTLKNAVPEDGDEVGYKIDDVVFAANTYSTVAEAIEEIEKFEDYKRGDKQWQR